MNKLTDGIKHLIIINEILFDENIILSGFLFDFNNKYIFNKFQV